MASADYTLVEAPAERSSFTPRRVAVAVASALMVTVGVVCLSVAFISSGRVAVATETDSLRRLFSSEGLPVSSMLGRSMVELTYWPDIKKTYFCPYVSHGNMPLPISTIFGSLFTSNGVDFFGSLDTEGTPSRVAATNDVIEHLDLTLEQLEIVGSMAARAIDDRKALADVVLSAIIPQFVPSFRCTDEFYEDYKTVFQLLFPSIHWANPFNYFTFNKAKARMLIYLDNRADVFHHSMASGGLLDVLQRLNEADIQQDIIDSQDSGGYNIIRLFLGDGTPAGKVPRSITTPTDLDGLVSEELSEGSMVIFKTDRPDVKFREERFLACAAQRVVVHIAYYTAKALMPNMKFVMVRSATESEALNPSSTRIFHSQGEL